MEPQIARFVYLAMKGSVHRTEEEDEELHRLYEDALCSTPEKPEVSIQLKLAISLYESEYPHRKKLGPPEMFRILGAEKCN
jgi:hypothetical protein